MMILRRLEKNKDFLVAIIISFLFFLLRLPSLSEPYWYGDEGIYHAVGIAINNGQLLYKDIFDNKPPLLYLLYAFLNADQFLVRFSSIIFGILSIIFFFFLSKRLFQNSLKNTNNIAYITTFIFALLFGLPFLEGNIANAENFILLPLIACALLIFSFIDNKPNKLYLLFISGLLLSIAFLFKIVAVFDFAAFLTFLFIVNFTSLKNVINEIKENMLFITGFFSSISLVSLYFILNGAFSDFLNATLTTNISYVNYANRISGLPVLLFVKTLALISFIVFIFIKRKYLDKTSLFIFIWTAFSLFSVLFSQRPYTHYALLIIPGISLLLGLIFYDKKNRKFVTIYFLLVLMVLINTFSFSGIKKTIPYYQNFIDFVNGNKTVSSYFNFFDKNTARDYEIALFIKSKLEKNDTIFVWGDNAQLYKLTNSKPISKYVVAYHITGYKDGIPTTKSSLEREKPKFIIVIPNNRPIPFPLINYQKKIIINNAMIYEKII